MDYNLDAIRNNPLYKLIKLELKKETGEIPNNIIDALTASANPSLLNPFLTLADSNLAFEFDAFITQADDTIPELIVRRNTYGEYTVEYVTIGTYNIVFNNTVLTDNLTFPNSTPIVNIDASGNIFSYSRINNKTIQITSSNSDSDLTDGLLNGFHIYFNTTVKAYTEPITTPPGEVTIISPTDEDTDVIIEPTLQWVFGNNTDEYELLFGTNPTPVNIVIPYTTSLHNSYQPIVALDNEVTYYWQINTKNQNGITEGAIQSFTTIAEEVAPNAPYNLLPIDEGVNIENGTSLRWTFGANTEEYKLILDTNDNPTTVIVDFTNVLASTHVLSGLTNGTTYYWKVIAKNAIGETSSAIQSFTAKVASAGTLNISVGDLDYLKDKRAVMTALVTPASATVENQIEYADSIDFSDKTVIEGEDILVAGGEQMAVFLLPKMPIGSKYVRIKVSDGTTTAYSNIHTLYTYPGTGRDRTQTDYSTELAASRALYTGSTYYIDPDIAVSGNGLTPETAYKSWSEIGWFPSGRHYLQKAGTTDVLDSNFIGINTNTVHLGTYGGTERAKIQVTNESGYFIETRARIHIENLEIEGLYKDVNDQFSGVGIRLRNSAGSYIYNCSIHGFGSSIVLSPVNGVNGASWSGCKILYTEAYDCATDGMYFDDVTDVEVGHCNIHHVNLMYNYSTDDTISPGDGIQAAFTETEGGDFLKLNIHHTTIDRSDSGNKFCLIWGAGSLYRHCEIDVEYNEFIINEKNQSCIYTDTALIGYANVSNNDFYGPETGAGHGIYNRHTATAPLTVENNVFKGLGLVLNNAYGRADITKNTFINNAIAFSVYTDGYDIKFNRNIVIGDENSRLIYGNQTEKLVESDYNCYNMPTILTSAATLAQYQALLGKDTHSISDDPDFKEDYSLESTSPCISLGGDYIGAIPYSA